jgi:hypothetical protein
MLNNLLTVSNLLETTIVTTLITQMDPLEQFDVLAISLPLVGDIGFTNLSLLLAFNIVVMGS